MNFDKKLLIVRTHLDAKGYHNALRSLLFARRYHKGIRKDGFTPEFDHQLSIALHAMSLPRLLYPEATFCAIFLHDVSEDYAVSRDEILAIFTCADLALMVGDAVECLTKKYRGVVKDEAALFLAMAGNAIASLVKGLDRSHNLSTMLDVFTPAKQIAYCDFAEHHILPMMKTAREGFPEQRQSYENLKHMIVSQVTLVRAIHTSANA